MSEDNSNEHVANVKTVDTDIKKCKTNDDKKQHDELSELLARILTRRYFSRDIFFKMIKVELRFQ